MPDKSPLLSGSPTTPERLIFASQGQFVYTAVCCPHRQHRGIIVTVKKVDEVDLDCQGTASQTIDAQFVPPPPHSVGQTTDISDFLAEECVGARFGEPDFTVHDLNIYKGRLGDRGMRYRFSQDVGAELRNYSFQLHRLALPLDDLGNAMVVFVADDSQEIDENEAYHTLQVNAATVRRGRRKNEETEEDPLSALFRLQAVFDSVAREFFIILKLRRQNC